MSHVNAGERMQLETAHILERIGLDDPEAAVRLKQVLRLRVAESYLYAADAVGNQDRGRAFGLLGRGAQEARGGSACCSRARAHHCACRTGARGQAFVERCTYTSRWPRDGEGMILRGCQAPAPERTRPAILSDGGGSCTGNPHGPAAIRTRDLLLRRQALYPAELRTPLF